MMHHARASGQAALGIAEYQDADGSDNVWALRVFNDYNSGFKVTPYTAYMAARSRTARIAPLSPPPPPQSTGTPPRPCIPGSLPGAVGIQPSRNRHVTVMYPSRTPGSLPGAVGIQPSRNRHVTVAYPRLTSRCRRASSSAWRGTSSPRGPGPRATTSRPRRASKPHRPTPHRPSPRAPQTAPPHTTAHPSGPVLFQGLLSL